MNEQLNGTSILDRFSGTPGGFATRERTSLVYNPSIGMRRDDKEIFLRDSKGTVGFDLRFVQNSGGMTVVEATPQEGIDVCVLKFNDKGQHYWSATPDGSSDPDEPYPNNIRISSVTPEVSSNARFQPHDPGMVRVEYPSGEVRFYLVKATFDGKPDKWNINYSVTEGTLPERAIFDENKTRLLKLFGREMSKRLVSRGSPIESAILLKNFYSLYDTDANHTANQELNRAITHFQTAGDLRYFRAGLWRILGAAKVELAENQYNMNDYRFGDERFQVPDSMIDEGASYYVSPQSLAVVQTLGRHICDQLISDSQNSGTPNLEDLATYINALVNSVPLTAALTLPVDSFYFEMSRSALLSRIERTFAEMVRGMQYRFTEIAPDVNLPGPHL